MKCSSHVLALVFTLILFSSFALAEEKIAPTMELTSMCYIDINSITFDEQSSILNFNFVVMNKSTNHLGNLRYNIWAKQNGETKLKYDDSLSEGLSPENATRIILDFDVPRSIESGDYNFGMILFYNDHVFCGISEYFEPVKIEGLGSWLGSPNGFIRTGIGDLNYYDGTPVPSDRGITIVLPFDENPKLESGYDSKKEYSASAEMYNRNDSNVIYKRFTPAKMELETFEDGTRALSYKMDLNSGEEIGAGSYQLTVKLFDETELQVGQIGVRWLVEGLSARIGDLNLQKKRFAANESIPLFVNIYMLGQKSGTKLKVNVVILGTKGESIAVEKIIDGNEALIKADFSDSTTQNAFIINNVSVKVYEESGETMLADYSFDVPLDATDVDELTAAQAQGSGAGAIPLEIIVAVILIVIVLAVVGFFMVKKGKGKGFISVLVVLSALVLFSSFAMACSCDITTWSMTKYSNSPCCASVYIGCDSCGNCQNATAAGGCSLTGGGGHDDTWATYNCCSNEGSTTINLYGGVNATALLVSNTINCCTPASPYNPKCGQHLGCGIYNGTSNIGDWYNSCDAYDTCGYTRSVSPFNSCSLTSNTACGNESTAQCDGYDNDCDALVDYEAGVSGLECAKNNYNPAYVSGGLTYGGDCTNACKVCKDNKVTSLAFTSINNSSSTETYNILNSDSDFNISLTAVSPNNCITGYNFVLEYSADKGSTWKTVNTNTGVGSNNFATSTLVLSAADTIVQPKKATLQATTENLRLDSPVQNAFFKSNDPCITSKDCDAFASEICVNKKCVSSSNYFLCKDSNTILSVLEPDKTKLFDITCDIPDSYCKSTADGNVCVPTTPKVCDDFGRAYSLDNNGRILSKQDCDLGLGEVCLNGSCCIISRQCANNNTEVNITDTCGGSQTITCDATKNESCMNGGCCAPTTETTCNSNNSAIMKVDSCGNNTLLTSCASDKNEVCTNLGGGVNNCCAPTTNYVCGTDPDNKVYVTDTCGRKTIKEDCGVYKCSNGACCIPNIKSECTDNNTAVNTYDSCGIITKTACAAGKLCTNGYCLTTYSNTVGKGERNVSTSLNTYKFKFAMRYMPVGYYYRIKAQLIDSKSARNISGAAYADGSYFISNVIKVSNTIPTKPSIALLDRNITTNSTKIYTRVNTTDDPDVFPQSPTAYVGSQLLSYFARIFPEEIKANPGSNGTSTTTGDFNAADVLRYYNQPLLAERVYCSEGRAFDGINYSPVSDQFCGEKETPFLPSCASLGLQKTLQSVSCNTQLNTTALAVQISCSRDPQFDEDWNIGINGVSFAKADGSNLSGTLVNSIVKCTSTPQTLFMTLNTGEVGAYTFDLNYGGVYNSVPLYCKTTESFAVSAENCSNNEDGSDNGGGANCVQYGFSSAATAYAIVPGNKMDINFTSICSGLQTAAIGKIEVFNKSGASVGLISPNKSCLTVPSINTVRLDTNAFETYSAKMDYNNGVCKHVIVFNVSSSGISQGAGSDINASIPDASIISAILALLAVAFIITRKRK